MTTATRKPLALVLAMLGLALTGCGKLADDLFCEPEGCGWKDGEWSRVAALANPGPPPEDASNLLRTDPFAQMVGQQLFFDTAFSGTATQVDAIRRASPPARAAKGQPLGISCATCHDLARAGVDTTSQPGHVSVGAGWTDVNALAVVNSAYRPVVFWNGRADSLWALNVVVAESATTLNGNRLRTAHLFVDNYLKTGFWPVEAGLLNELLWLLQRPFDCAALLSAVDEISALPSDGKPGNQAGCQAGDPSEPFGDVFDCLPPEQQKLVNSLLVIWAKAIAAYEYRLNSTDSPFDRYVRAGPSSDLISAAAKRGARLFVGKGACVDCHGGSQLSDEQFHNIGISQTGLTVPTTVDCPQGNPGCDCSDDHGSRPCAPWGAYDGLAKLKASKWLRSSLWSDAPPDATQSAYVDREQTEDLKGAWRTPSLRNVALTAPYMHDGRYATLEDVIWHYNTGGSGAGPEQVGVPAAQLKPLMLTDAEQADLIAFLETLTGDPLASEMTKPPAPPAIKPLSCSGGGPVVPPPGCVGTPPPSPVITDFSDGTADLPPRFGAASGFSGAAFSYAAPGLVAPVVSIAQGTNGTPALKVAVHTGAPTDPGSSWLGFGMSFDSCVDATAFDAVRFTITGDFGSCAIRFATSSSQTVNVDDDPRGSCMQPSCYPPSEPIRLPGTVTMPFSVHSFPGSPDVVDPKSIIGIQWQMDAPPFGCDATLFVDDVTFVRGGPTGAGGAGGSASGTGGTGVTGTGGAGGSGPPPVSCVSTLPPSPAVIDFSETQSGNPIVFGKPPGLTGRIFSRVYPPIAPLPPAILSIGSGDNATPALIVDAPGIPGTPPAWHAFGLTFDACLDLSAYDAVQFTMSGFSPSCLPAFGVMSKYDVNIADDPRGICPAPSCGQPLMQISAPGSVTAPISVTDPTSIVGIQWRIPIWCGGRLVIDDVAFVTR